MAGDCDSVGIGTLATIAVFAGFIAATPLQRKLAFGSCHSGHQEQSGISFGYGGILFDLGFGIAIFNSVDRMDERSNPGKVKPLTRVLSQAG